MDIYARFMTMAKTDSSRQTYEAQFIATLDKLKIWYALKKYGEVTKKALCFMIGKQSIDDIITGMTYLVPIYEGTEKVFDRGFLVLGLLDTEYRFEAMEKYAESIGFTCLERVDEEVITALSIGNITDRMACNIPGCENRKNKKGLCFSHWRKYQKAVNMKWPDLSDYYKSYQEKTRNVSEIHKIKEELKDGIGGIN